MAKKLLNNYTFTPGGANVGTLTFTGKYELKQFLLITNSTDNVIIFNFAGAGLGGTVSYNSSSNTTTLTLQSDTSSMSSSDELQIFFDDYLNEQIVTQNETYIDAVEKFRVSNPQALIDTDFEYSLQATKWESVQLQNNIPGIFQRANEPAYQGSSILSIQTASGGDWEATYNTITKNENGRTGMATIYSGNTGDSSIFYPFSFPINFLGTSYTFGYLGGNGYLLFGSSSFQYFNLASPDQPNIAAIKFCAADMRCFYMGRRLLGSSPNREMIIRWEGSTWGGSIGNSTGCASHIIEMRFYEGQSKVQVHYCNIRTNFYGGAMTGAIQDGPGPATGFLTNWVGGSSGNTLPTNGTSPYTVSYAVEATWGQAASSGLMEAEVDVAPSNPFYIGQPIILKDTKDPLYLDGAFLITAVPSTTRFRFKQKAPTAYVGDQKTDYTAIYTGGFFYKASLPISNIQSQNGTLRARINFSTSHGLFVGSKIYVVDSTQNDQNWVGAFVVERVISNTAVEYTVFGVTSFTSTATLSGLNTVVYARNEGVSQHRFYDGGVSINPSSNSPNAQIIRQTRRYFRYQSGKSIQFSTGILFRPVYDISEIEVDTTVFISGVQDYILLNITTDQEHGFLQPTQYRSGAVVDLEGFTVSSGSNVYNGTFTVFGVVSNTTFTVQIPVASIPADTAPGGIGRVKVTGWSDSVVRSGLFDDQNGLFFEHDGQHLFCVRRNSTQQLTGRLSATQDSSSVTGVGTKFKTQLIEGDYIVIKGSSYVVTDITSDTALTISPEYKATTITNQKCVKTSELRTRQDDFTFDSLDGNGPSGYVLDPNKMQMVFMDYSWYGAGKVRFGCRAQGGRILWFHEIINSNENTEAYMRTGNIPGRFEIQAKSKTGQLQAALGSSDTTMQILETDAEPIPAEGTILVNYEYMGYTKAGLSNGIRTLNLVRNIGGKSSNSTADVNDGWMSINQNCSPSLSHWGVSCIMDGQFDSDKSYLFTAPTTNSIFVPNNQRYALISVRLAPSVDYGIPGFYGIRNLINRSELVLDSIGLSVNGNFSVEVRVNPENTLFTNDSNWVQAANGSIAQFMDHSIRGQGTFSTLGDTVAAFFGDEGTNRFANSSYQIDSIRGLGNSILGGPNVYPDGPDVLTLFVINKTGSSRSAYGRITWTEAQG